MKKKERPILFSAPMIRALLAGTKTQTRRALKHQPIDILPMPQKPNEQWVTLDQREPEATGKVVRCRFGVPGDLLWIRETFMLVGGGDPGIPLYRADWREDAKRRGLQNIPASEPKGWKPSIHMPRWVSRIILRITDVRVERLQDISEADAMAEGIAKVGERWEADGIVATPYGARDAYKSVWNYVNGADAWDANPWVWALSFERVSQAARAAA